jgi:hypothetical protein
MGPPPPVPEQRRGIAEYGLLMSGGGYHIRSIAPQVGRIFPTAEWIVGQIRTGGHVYRRRVIVVEDWEEVFGG